MKNATNAIPGDQESQIKDNTDSLDSFDLDIDALFWANRGVRLSQSFAAHPPKIIGRCNDLTRGVKWSKEAKAYMSYKAFLRHQLAVPESMARDADGLVIEVFFALPKGCIKKNGQPTKEGDRRLKGLVKCLPTDVDNLGKPIQDAVMKGEDEAIRDADLMILYVEKRWGMENKIIVRLLLPMGVDG